MDEIKQTYDGKFQGNILVVDKQHAKKTTFVQILGKNNLFGDISEVYWISKIPFSNQSEDTIRGSFSNQEFILTIQIIWKILII